MKISRKAFLRFSALTAGGASLAVLTRCGESQDPYYGGPIGGVGGGAGAAGGIGTGNVASCTSDGAHASLITGNHGHALNIPAPDFSAAGDKTYDIRGSADHTHSVTLTQPYRSTIARGNALTVTSSVTDGHSHDLTVVCS